MPMRPLPAGLLAGAALALALNLAPGLGLAQGLKTALAGAGAEPAQLAQNEEQSYQFEPLNSGSGGNRGISLQEREIVQTYVSGGRGSIAAWQSSLERLPPGVTPHGLPNALQGALPPRREEDWMVAGYSLLLVDRETGTIVDVWSKVFEPY